jgi:putative phosphoribosyl transferase
MSEVADTVGIPFRDRRDAGRQLASYLRRYAAQDPVVLALPRGGVPVGYEVATALGAPLDVVVVRKLGAPGQRELAVGAVVDGDHPEEVLNEDLVRVLGVSPQYLAREVAAQLEEIRRRQVQYRGHRARVPVAGRTVIVVDDGIATGASIRAALRGVRRARPRKLVLAVPVAPPDTIAALRRDVDEVVCPHMPEAFGAVGSFYDDFSQTTDDDVIRLLDAAAAARPHPDSRQPHAPAGAR